MDRLLTMRSILVALVILAFLVIPAAVDAESLLDASAWMEGADGLVDALEKVKGSPSPLVMYFYTDWCGYCRQFEAELLGSDELRSWLSAGLAVRINPESGDTERQIAGYYGVRGYPGFFVYNPSSGNFLKVQRMTIEGGQPRLMVPSEFIAVLEEAGQR